MSQEVREAPEYIETVERVDDIGFGGLRLIQKPEEFCYGIDAVLLAEFAATCGNTKRGYCKPVYGKGTALVDLGTGTGIIPVLLSHMTGASTILGVEIQGASYERALKNIDLNGLSVRMAVIQGDVSQEDLVSRLFEINGGKGFDGVTCNPPYMPGGKGITNKGDAKTIARHEVAADLEDFIRTAAGVLKDKGDFYMVHRPARLVDISCLCRKYRLEPKEMRFVQPNREGKPNILLVHCVKNAGAELKFLPLLHVYDEQGQYSEEILKIYER